MPSMSVSVTMSDLEMWDIRGQNFLVDFRNYAQTFWRRAMKSGVIPHMGQQHVSRCAGNPGMPQSQGGKASETPNLFGPLSMLNGLTSSDEISCGNTWGVVFLWCQPLSPLKGAGPIVPENVCDLLQVCTVIQYIIIAAHD